MKKLIISLIIMCFVLAPALGRSEGLQGARIDDVRVSLSPNLNVSFQVKDAFTKDIEEAILSGIATSFTFIVELERVNRLWPDDKVGRWEFKHTVKYDTLKEEYQISLDETGERNIRTKDLTEMKGLMTTGSSVAISPAHLVAGEVYEVRVMAELKTIELPFLLNYMFFFVKIFDIETDWYEYRFSP